MSRIEQLISDIEAYIDNCKYQPFSNNKIIVDKDQLEDMLSELRLKTPDEIKKYQKILNNKDAIISDAKEQAESILNAAQIQTEELINEHEIMQRAYAQANQLIGRQLRRHSAFWILQRRMLITSVLEQYSIQMTCLESYSILSNIRLRIIRKSIRP